jgi:hypothetical protein
MGGGSERVSHSLDKSKKLNVGGGMPVTKMCLGIGIAVAVAGMAFPGMNKALKSTASAVLAAAVCLVPIMVINNLMKR